MKYLDVSSTGGLLSVAGIPFEKLAFTHDIDSLKDLCTSLVKIESTVDEWNLVRMDAEHYLFTLDAKACSPKMLAAIGDSLMDTLANFKASPLEGTLIINIFELGKVVCETSEIGGVTHIDHVHEPRTLKGRKVPLGDAFDGKTIVLKMSWQPRINDTDVTRQLAMVHGINNLDCIVSMSKDVPSNARTTDFILTADSNNGRYYGSYTVQIEWTGRRPHRATSRVAAEPVKENIDELLRNRSGREITIHPDRTPSAADLYADLLDEADVELPRMPLFLPVAWPDDTRDQPTKVMLCVSPDDNEYTGSVWVTINWRKSVTIDNRLHINSLFNGREGLTLNLERHTHITADAVFSALCAKCVTAMPDVKLVNNEWKIQLSDMYTLVDISVSPDDSHFYGDLKVHINWL
jgi:hypothetical protein